MDGNALSLSIKKMTKVFPKGEGELVALQDIDLDVIDGEFVCVLGPSGCGKTTLLRIIAGLEPKSSGSMVLKGKEIEGPGPDRGMVFQEFALFPWRSVRRNVEFGLEIKKMPPEMRKETSQKYIDLVGLKGFEDSHPNQLSGGMKQCWHRQGSGQRAFDPANGRAVRSFGRSDQEPDAEGTSHLVRDEEDHRIHHPLRR